MVNVRRTIEEALDKSDKRYAERMLRKTEQSELIDALFDYALESQSSYDELKVLRDKIKDLSNKSGQRVRCLDVLPNRRALVKLGPIAEELMVSPNITLSKLKPGCEVLVIGGQDGRMIAEIREPCLTEGRFSKVVRKLDESRVVISDGGHDLIMRLVNDVECDIGDEVRYDLEAQMVLEVIGQNQEKTIFSLSEKPTATFDDIKGLEEEKRFLRERIVYPAIYREKFKKYGLKGIRGALLHGPPGCGKAQPLDSLILTPNGFVKMKDISVGDFVSIPDGGQAKVIGVFPQGIKDIYKISFNDGTNAECCEEHLWHTKTSLDRKNHREGGIKSLKEIIPTIKYGKKRNHSIPITKPVYFNQQNNLPIDPYVLGCLLGDGNFSYKQVRFTTKDKEIVEHINKFLTPLNCNISACKESYEYVLINNNLKVGRIGRRVKKIDKNGSFHIYENISLASKDGFNKHGIYRAKKFNRKYKGFDWEFLDPQIFAKNIIKDKLIKLNLFGKKSNNKFIPELYKKSSIENRIKLLQGLMDTDGTICKYGKNIGFTSISKNLINDIKFIIESLGGQVRRRKKILSTYKNKYGEPIYTGWAYPISVSLPNDINPFCLDRKSSRVVGRKKYPISRYIDKIEYVGKKEAKCILVDHPSHLYITNDFIVTHNTMFAGAIFNEMAKLQEKETGGGFFVINGPEVLSKWAGNTEEAIRNIFKEARKASKNTGFPAIIFWDEIESITARRKDSATYTPEKTVVPTLLAELQGVKDAGDVILIGATNRPDLIDPALMRPGRLGDAILEIPRPSQEGALEILQGALKRAEMPVSLRGLVEGGLVEKVIAHVYENVSPLAKARTQSGEIIGIMRAEMVNGALFAQIGDELMRKACVAEIYNADAPTLQSAIEMTDTIFLNQLGVLDAGVKNGFTIDPKNVIIDVSLNG